MFIFFFHHYCTPLYFCVVRIAVQLASIGLAIATFSMPTAETVSNTLSSGPVFLVQVFTVEKQLFRVTPAPPRPSFPNTDGSILVCVSEDMGCPINHGALIGVLMRFGSMTTRFLFFGVTV